MYYFENDPLEQVYADLSYGKTQTHFDKVLLLKDTAKNDFSEAIYRVERKPNVADQPPVMVLHGQDGRHYHVLPARDVKSTQLPNSNFIEGM